MKKHLLKLSLLLLISSFSFAQQGKLANVSYQTGRTISTSVMHKSKLTQPVPTTTTSTCMSVNLPVPAGWSQSNYGTGTPIFTNGFINGPNIYGDKEKAMYFDLSASSNTLITQAYISFDKAYTATPSKTIAVNVYQGSTGTVGAALGTATITMGEIITDIAANRYSLVIFSNPIPIASKKFFMSVDVSALQFTTMPKDSLSIVSNKDPQTNPTQVWEKTNTNVWRRYTTTGSWNLNISLLIHPFLTQSPMVSTFSTSSNTICAGQSVNYNSSGSTAGTYQWFFGAIGTPTAAGATAAATYSAAGTYTTILIVSDACGSLDGIQTFITVKPTPTVSATPISTVICSGTNITLNGGGASSYVWTGGATNGTSFAPANGNYTVTGTAANGCTNTAVASVTVNSLPVVAATSGTICNGSSFVIAPSGANTYTITGGMFSVSPTSSTSYSLTGTSIQGCLSSNIAISTVVVNNLPMVTANSTPTSICVGSSVTLSGGGATTYTWTGTVVNGVAFAPTSTKTYTVNGTDANGCLNTATTTVNVNNLPSVLANSSSTLACAGDNITLTGSGATTYTWNNGVTNGVGFTASTTNTYTVNGTDVNGCVGSATVQVVVSSCTGINNLTSANSVTTIFPNPNNGEFTITAFSADVLSITNELGQTIQTVQLNSANNFTYKVSGLAVGIYFVTGKSVKQKIVVTK